MALEIERQPRQGVVLRETNVPKCSPASSNNANDNILQVPTGSQNSFQTRQEKNSIGEGTSLARAPHGTDSKSDVRLDAEHSSGPMEVHVRPKSVEQKQEDCVSDGLIETEGCEEDHIFVQVMECEEGDTLLQLEKYAEGEILFEVQGCDESQILIQVEEFEDNDTATRGQAADSFAQVEVRLNDGATERDSPLSQSGEYETNPCMRKDRDTLTLQEDLGKSKQRHYSSPQATLQEQCKPQSYNYTVEASDPHSQPIDTTGCREGSEMQFAPDDEGMDQSKQDAPCMECKPQSYNYTVEASDPHSQPIDTTGCREGSEMQFAPDDEGMNQSKQDTPCMECKPQSYNYTVEALDPHSQPIDTAICREGSEMQFAPDGEGMNQSKQDAPCMDRQGLPQGPGWEMESQWGDTGRKLEETSNMENQTPSVADLEKKLKSSLAENDQHLGEIAMLQNELRFTKRETVETRKIASSMLDSLNALCEQQAEVNKQQGQVEVALRNELDFFKLQLKYKEERCKEMHAYIISLEAEKQTKDHALYQHAAMIENLRGALSMRDVASQKDKTLLKERDVQMQELRVQVDVITKQVKELKDTLALKTASEAGNVMVIEALQQQLTVLVEGKLQQADLLEKALQEKQEQAERVEKLRQELNALKNSGGDQERLLASQDQEDASSEETTLQRDDAICVAEIQSADREETSPQFPLTDAIPAIGEAADGAKSPCSTLERPPSGHDAAASDTCRDGDESPVRLTSLLRSLLHDEEEPGSKRMLDAEEGDCPESKRQNCRRGQARSGGCTRTAKTSSASRRSRRH